MDSSTAGPSKPMAFKRPLFNKPAWSKPQAAPSTTDFFNRSNQTYMNVAAQEELRRKKKAAKKERERISQGVNEQREEKRRRISDVSEDEDDCDSSEDGGNNTDRNREESREPEVNLPSPIKSTGPVNPITLPSSLARSYADTVAAAKARSERPALAKVIDLESDDDSYPADGEKAGIGVTAVKPAEPAIYDNIELSDEEFPELAQQAREKARMKRLQADSPTKVMPDQQLGLTIPISTGRSQSVRASKSPPPPIDSVVSILITSSITNTNPLIVNRRIGQRLKEVRITWCQKQQFSPEFTNTIILVWRGKRLFDITSCRSLGIGVDGNGNIVTQGKRDILGEENGKIHMEAMTEEMFDEQKKAKARESCEIQEEPVTEQAVVEQPVQERQVKIILKAKGFDEFKLIVKPVRIPSE